MRFEQVGSIETSEAVLFNLRFKGTHLRLRIALALASTFLSTQLRPEKPAKLAGSIVQTNDAGYQSVPPQINTKFDSVSARTTWQAHEHTYLVPIVLL